MEKAATRTVAEIAAEIGGDVIGDGQRVIRGLAPLKQCGPDQLTFADGAGRLKGLDPAKFGALLVQDAAVAPDATCILVPDVRRAFLTLLAQIPHGLQLPAGVSPLASVDPTVDLAPDVRIGPYAVVEADVVLAEGVHIFAHAFVGHGSEIGPRTRIYPHAVLYDGTITGEDCVIHAHAVIGAAGFGFADAAEGKVAVPQVGHVELGNRVEIGAGTCIDRATVGKTRLGDGCKIDNLVQIGHNVQLGANVVLASQVGIAGSTEIGERVLMGGQVGVADNITIAARSVFAGQTGITSSIREPDLYMGFPARSRGEFARLNARLSKLDQLFARVKALEERAGSTEESPA